MPLDARISLLVAIILPLDTKFQVYLYPHLSIGTSPYTTIIGAYLLHSTKTSLALRKAQFRMRKLGVFIPQTTTQAKITNKIAHLIKAFLIFFTAFSPRIFLRVPLAKTFRSLLIFRIISRA